MCPKTHHYYNKIKAYNSKQKETGGKAMQTR